MIHYIANFSGNKSGLHTSPAGESKMSYIISLLKRTSEPFTVISTAEADIRKFSFAGTEKISDNGKIKYFSSFNLPSRVLKRAEKLWNKIQLYLYFKFYVKDNDTVIIYHDISYIKTITKINVFRKFKIIFEIEEIYGDVLRNSEVSKREIKLFDIADSYIFPTELLNKKINISNKPYVIIHGTYEVEQDRKCKFIDGKIHCVYAGTFDPRKGGAAAAASAAHLDSNYHIHVIGFGSEKDKLYLKEHIRKIAESTKCTVTYDGLLTGEEYIKFIQSCHIGLSTQNPNAEFNETSFPSKVLSYMANGLRVVSIRIKALETSDVNNLLYYYNEDSPKLIAEAIKSIDIHDNYDSRQTIKDLDNIAMQQIKQIF